MTTYIISTCGKSLLEATCWDWWCKNDTSEDPWKDWEKKQFIEKISLLQRSYKAMEVVSENKTIDVSKFGGHMDHLSQFNKIENFNAFPAEIASLYNIIEKSITGDELASAYFYFVFPDETMNKDIYELLKKMLVKLWKKIDADKIKDMPLASLATYINGDKEGEVHKISKKIIENVANIPGITNNGNKAIFNLTGGPKAFLLAFQRALILNLSKNDYSLPPFKIVNYFEDADHFTKVFDSENKDKEPAAIRKSIKMTVPV